MAGWNQRMLQHVTTVLHLNYRPGREMMPVGRYRRWTRGRPTISFMSEALFDLRMRLFCASLHSRDATRHNKFSTRARKSVVWMVRELWCFWFHHTLVISFRNDFCDVRTYKVPPPGDFTRNRPVSVYKLTNFTITIDIATQYLITLQIQETVVSLYLFLFDIIL